jgi:hypothetical protein
LPDYLPKIFDVKFGSKFFIPAENSIYLSFKPTKSAKEGIKPSAMG